MNTFEDKGLRFLRIVLIGLWVLGADSIGILYIPN